MAVTVWTGRNGAPVTTRHIDTDRRSIDVSKTILELEPDATPFLVILANASKGSTGSLEYIWYDNEPDSCWTRVMADYDNLTDTLTVDDATIFRVDDILKNTRTGEVMSVKSIESATSIKVYRQFGYEALNNIFIGGTQATAGVANDNLLRLGQAMKEGWTAPEPRGSQPKKLYNYIQTFSHTIMVTEDNENERKVTGGSERLRQRKLVGVEHRKDIERALMFGERMDHTDHQKRLTGGVLQFIKSNCFDVGTLNAGTLTEQLFEKYCETLFRYGSKTKLFVCSPRIGSVINEFGKKHIEMVPEKDVYGLRLSRYKSFHGNLIIATSHLFERDYAGLGIGMDVGNINYNVFAGKDSTLNENIQAKDAHALKDEIYTQCGTKVRLEKTHAILTGVQKGVEAA